MEVRRVVTLPQDDGRSGMWKGRFCASHHKDQYIYSTVCMCSTYTPLLLQAPHSLSGPKAKRGSVSGFWIRHLPRPHMGLVQSCCGHQKPLHVVLLGLDSAGKSTIFYKLRAREDFQTQPTIGFNVGMQQMAKKVALTLWDVGGQAGMRRHWGQYLGDCRALVFVVDSGDRHRIPEAARALRHVLARDAVKGVPLIVLANKCDLPDTMDLSEVVETLGLNNCKDRDWVIQAVSGLNGQGLQQAFQSIAELIKDNKGPSCCH